MRESDLNDCGSLDQKDQRISLAEHPRAPPFAWSNFSKRDHQTLHLGARSSAC